MPCRVESIQNVKEQRALLFMSVQRWGCLALPGKPNDFVPFHEIVPFWPDENWDNCLCFPFFHSPDESECGLVCTCYPTLLMMRLFIDAPAYLLASEDTFCGSIIKCKYGPAAQALELDIKVSKEQNHHEVAGVEPASTNTNIYRPLQIISTVIAVIVFRLLRLAQCLPLIVGSLCLCVYSFVCAPPFEILASSFYRSSDTSSCGGKHTFAALYRSEVREFATRCIPATKGRCLGIFCQEQTQDLENHSDLSQPTLKSSGDVALATV